MLYADDLGYGDLGCYSDASKIPTPHLDRLASEGMRFSDAHSSSGICTPSRYALLTGRHHWRKFHGISMPFGQPMLDADRLTLPEMLQARGYRTACIGKWHLGWDWAAIKKPGRRPMPRTGYRAKDFDWSRPIPGGPLANGFDSYFGDDVPNFPPYAWIENDRVVVAPTVPYAPAPIPPEGQHEGRPGPMVAGWRLDGVMPELTRRAVKWLGQQKGSEEPFFLFFPFTSPHAPIVPAKEFVGASEAGPYGDFVVQSDAAVGAVLQALDDAGLRDNTIVVFSADNGPEAYAYERMRTTGHSSPGELRGLKRDVWEGGHRVPMIVRWPEVVSAGSESDALVSQCDLMATFASIAGATLPMGTAEDSFDLEPLWRGNDESVREFLVHNTFKNKWGVRRGRWLLLLQKGGYHNRTPKWVHDRFLPLDGDVFLCDLAKDLAQTRDVSAQHPDVVAELRSLLVALRAGRPSVVRRE
ncbi:MAG: arylsulfatase [Planctomycetota bacterium]